MAVTVYVPAAFTVISFVVAPLLHSIVAPEEGTAESITSLSEQKLAVGPFEIDTVGMGRAVTSILAVSELQKFPSIAVTAYVPAAVTVILVVVALLLQTTVAPAEGTAESNTVALEQKLIAGPFEIDTVGIGSDVTSTLAASELQRLAAVAVTVYVPAEFTVIAFVVAPLLQSTVAPAEGTAESITFLFEQKLAVGPFETDTVGIVSDVTSTLAVSELQRLVPVAVTVYVPAALTVISFVVAPLLHSTVAPEDGTADKITSLFEQKLAVAPLETDTVGIGSDVTVTLDIPELQRLASVAVTVYVPAVFTVILLVVAPVFQSTVAPLEGTAVSTTF